MSKGSGKVNTAKPSSVGNKSVSTSYDASGEVLLVENPIDIVYLCWKMEAAKRTPYICKDKRPRYQREVTKWIRQDAKLAGYQFPYCGEVGYNMTKYPPEAIMSQTESNRPSEFPLSQYRMIYREYRELNVFGDPVGSYRFDFSGADVFNPIVTKTELENTLTLKRSNDNDIKEAYRTINPEVAQEAFPNGRGMLRIPDVIKKKNYRLLGKEGYNPSNIDTVIEVKFPGDSLSKKQRQAYLKIASNDIKKLRLMTLEQCEFRRRRGKEEEEMMANAKADPIFQVIGETALANPKQALSIEQQMQMEYDAFSKHVIKWVTQQQLEYSRPQLVAFDDYDEQLFREAWRRYEERHEQIVNAPLTAVGVAAVGTAIAAPLVASGAETVAVATVTRGTAEVIKFPTIVKATVAAGGATALPLAAQQKSNHHYLLEKNNQLTYYVDFSRYQPDSDQDDRLIEIDYRYHPKLGKITPPIIIEDDSSLTKLNRHQYRISKQGMKLHYYPPRQQFYYYFTPGDEPTMANIDNRNIDAYRILK